MDHAAHDELVEDEMDFVHVENQVELADILEALVQGLDENLDQVQDAELRLARVDAEHEEQGGVVSVDELVVWAANQAER